MDRLINPPVVRTARTYAEMKAMYDRVKQADIDRMVPEMIARWERFKRGAGKDWTE